MKSIRRTRRNLYSIASILGDVNAISRGPTAIAKRYLIHKPAWRTWSRIFNKLR